MDLFLSFLYVNRYLLTILYLTIINSTAFVLCGMDKLYAENGMFRIRERTLLLISFFLGAAGMLLGMIIFRHKTKKSKFVLTVPVLLLLQLFTLLFLEAKYNFLSHLIL